MRDAAVLGLIHAALRHPESLSARDLSAGARDSSVAAWFASQGAVLARAPGAVVEDPTSAAVIDELLAAADRSTEAVEKMTAAAVERALAAVRADDAAAVNVAVNCVLPRISPAAPTSFAATALHVIDPRLLSRDIRASLLPVLARATSPKPGDVSAKLAAWLSAPADELAGLLKLPDLSEAHKAAACYEVVRRDAALPPDAASELAAKPAAALKLMRSLGDDAAGHAAAAAGFHAVIVAGGGKAMVDGLLEKPGGFPAALIDLCLCPLIADGRLKPRDAVAQYGSALLPRLGGGKAAADLVARLLADPSLGRGRGRTSRAALAFVDVCAAADFTSLAPAARDRARAWVTLRDFRRGGSVSYESLASVAAAVAAVGDERFSTRAAAVVSERVARVLLRPSWRGSSVDRFRVAVEGVIVALSRLPGVHPARVYRDVLSRVRNRRAFWRRPALVAAMIEIACGEGLLASATPMIRGELKQPRHELAERIARRGRLFDFVDERAVRWGDEPVKLWRAMKKAYPPRPAHAVFNAPGLLKMIVAGGLLAILALLVWKVWESL